MGGVTERSMGNVNEGSVLDAGQCTSAHSKRHKANLGVIQFGRHNCPDLAFQYFTFYLLCSVL